MNDIIYKEEFEILKNEYGSKFDIHHTLSNPPKGIS